MFQWLMALIISISASLPVPSDPQVEALHVVGTWEGVLTQDRGGFTPEYRFRLELSLQDGRVVGSSYVSVQNIHAEWSLVGHLKEGTFYFEETSLGDHTELEDLYWCLKEANLYMEMVDYQWVMYGQWHGKSEFGPCIPGHIRLIKVVPQV